MFTDASPYIVFSPFFVIVIKLRRVFTFLNYENIGT